MASVSEHTGVTERTGPVAVGPARRPLGVVIGRLLTTTDHKLIGHMYLITSFAFFLIGGVMALLIRAELAKPGLQIVNEEVYNQLFTMHGTIMLLLFATPLFVGFANVIMPVQIGAPDVAFPRLNMFSYWLFLFGGLITLSGVPHPGRRGRLRLDRLRPAVQRGPLAGYRRRPVDHGSVDGRSRHHPRCGQLRHDDHHDARTRYDDVPDADLHLEHPGHVDPGADRVPDPGRRAADAGGGPSPRGARLRCRRTVGRCCGSTCSGSSGIPRSTSSRCRSSASSPRSCRCSAASRSSATSAWSRRRMAIAALSMRGVGAPHVRHRRR